MAFTKAFVRDVLHPTRNRYINGAAYSREIGDQGLDVSPDARCPFCLKLAMVPEWSDGVVRHFFHRHRGSSGSCPLVTVDVQSGFFQAESIYSPDTSSANREAFLAVWYRQFLSMKRLVGSLNVERFFRLIEHADILNLWSHSAFRLDDMPAVLLVLADLVADTSETKRRIWVRFKFAELPTSLDGLWGRKKTPALFKLSYKPRPDGRLPNYKELTHCARVAIDCRSIGGAGDGPSFAEALAFERFTRSHDGTHGLSIWDEVLERPIGLASGLSDRPIDGLPHST